MATVGVEGRSMYTPTATTETTETMGMAEEKNTSGETQRRTSNKQTLHPVYRRTYIMFSFPKHNCCSCAAGGGTILPSRVMTWLWEASIKPITTELV